MPKAATLTAIYMKLTAAIGTGSGDTVACNINVNGTKVTTDDNGATFTCTADYDDGTDTVSATGSIALAQDALVCWEFTFSGDTTTDIRFVTARYTVARE
jgi:hypothetical protein